MICAVNGPVRLHSEIALLSDIILCSDDAVFQWNGGIVPGDGVHTVWLAALGWASVAGG